MGDLSYFIDEQTNFCQTFKHVKPYYAKQQANYKEISACIVANGFTFGTCWLAQSL